MTEGDETPAASVALPMLVTRKKAVILLLAINALLLAGLLVGAMKRRGRASAHDAAVTSVEASSGSGAAPADPQTAEIGPSVSIDDFIIQLRSPDGGDRYARFHLVLEVKDQPATERVTRRIGRVRDSVLAVMSDLTPDDLRGSAGLRQMKDVLRARVGGATGVDIRAIYVADFVIM